MRFNFWQKNLGRSYWQTGVIPALVSFFLVSGPILSTWACFWVPRPSDGKKPITYSDTEFYSESSGKNFFPKISRHKKARATSKRVFEHILAADWKSLFCFVYISNRLPFLCGGHAHSPILIRTKVRWLRKIV